MKKLMNDLTVALLSLHIKKIKQATYYAGPNAVVKITSVGKWRSKKPSLDYRVTLGRPNFEARRKLKRLVAAGAKFPVKDLDYKVRKKTT